MLQLWQAGAVQFGAMPDAMTIAASGIQAGMTALSASASQIVKATTPAPSPSDPLPQMPRSLPGYTLAYNPSAPFANLQDLVAVPSADLASAITGQIEAANGVRANLVVYRVASHLYRSLLKL